MSQLERLARPFPAKYVKKPAAGKYGSYVPHDVVQQALLAILGPVDISIGEILHGEDGKIEGCLVTLRAEIDGRATEVTEIGDCENPSNWKTQGARMKDAISDGVKRCAMRLGCGLHLWAQEDYFLYDQLKSQSSSGEHSVAESAGDFSSSPAISKVRVENLKARCVALQADGVSIADEREARGLPLVDSCDDFQLQAFEHMVAELEAELERPFESEAEHDAARDDFERGMAAARPEGLLG